MKKSLFFLLASSFLFFYRTNCFSQCFPISGPDIVCVSQPYTYSISGPPDNYFWTVPSGWVCSCPPSSTSISVTVNATSGNVCVYCPGGADSCMYVTVYSSAPAQPVLISGPDTICNETTVSYSISSDPNVAYYNWSVPVGWTINSGQGDTLINVTAGTDSGYICVEAVNGCGTSAPSCLSGTSKTAVTLYLGNDTTICNGCTVTLNAGTGFVNYSWSSGSTTQIITVDSAGTYWVEVIDTNGCNSTDTIIVNVISYIFEFNPIQTLNVIHNPFSSSLTLQFQTTATASVQYTIHDFTGKEIIRIQRNHLPKGKHTEQINTEQLSLGLYLLIANINGQILTTKILKM